MAPFFIATCLLYFAALLYGSLRTPGWFYRTCPDARPVPFLKQWPLVARLDARRRSLSAFWQRVYRICVPLLFAWNASDEREMDAIIETVTAVFLGFAALEGLIALAFLFVYLPIRLGWRSAVDDMAPR